MSTPFPTPVPGARPSAARGARLLFERVHLEAWAAEVPPVTVSTAELEDQLRPLYRKLGFKPGWVEAVTGIRERRMWAPGSAHHAGAARAAERALAHAGVGHDEVQAVVSCAVYKGRLEPSVACEVQSQLRIGSHCLNFDVGNACLGFITGLVQVAALIELGQIEVGLVVAAEDAHPVVSATIARLIDPAADIHTFKDNLATLTLGSAAAAAVLVSHRRSKTSRRFLGGTTRSAAHHHDLCVGDARGMVTDSVRLLREGVSLAGTTWDDVSDLLGWRVPDVTTFAMHQVGKAHHDAVLRQLGVPADRAPQIYPWLGNVGSCGVPVTAILAGEQGLHRAGDRVALMGIGSGLNCMMTGVQW